MNGDTETTVLVRLAGWGNAAGATREAAIAAVLAGAPEGAEAFHSRKHRNRDRYLVMYIYHEPRPKCELDGCPTHAYEFGAGFCWEHFKAAGG